LAKIAVESARAHGEGQTASRLLAAGDGWCVADVTCCAGPHDRPFEEQHDDVCIAIVTAGSFQYRSSGGRELMTPGSLLLGSPGQYFECGHEHGTGDRCISFSYDERRFEELAAETGLRNRSGRFSSLRVPPLREFSGVIARAHAALNRSTGARRQSTNHSTAGESEWEEMGVELAALALGLAGGTRNPGSLPSSEARVTRAVRMIEERPDGNHDLASLAREARLSRYHFIRVFRQLTGLTPHQYVLRVRLRLAAARLILEPARVVDVALDSGFGDVSNFNHAFRAEFGASPVSYRGNGRGKKNVE